MSREEKRDEGGRGGDERGGIGGREKGGEERGGRREEEGEVKIQEGQQEE